MEKDVFTKLKDGDPVNILDDEFVAAKEHMTSCLSTCFKINHTDPSSDEINPMIEELLHAPLKENTVFAPPMEVDYGKQLDIGEKVYINRGFKCMSAGGITIGDGCQVGPETMIITVNHDMVDKNILLCKHVTLEKNVWIGARTLIMPGVTIGENSVIAGGSVVVKDVEPNCVYGGNPAKLLKRIK